MRKALEELLFKGKVTETYEVYGMKWELKTLTSADQVDATAATSSLDTFARVNALKIAILARSIVAVESIKFADIDEAAEFIGKLQQPIVNALFEKYEDLQAKQKDSLDEVKNS